MIKVTAALLALSGVLAAAPARTIGSVTSVEYRVVLTAHRTSGGQAPTASVDVTWYRSGTRAGSRRLPGTYFWKVVTSPRSVCELSISTSGGRRAIGPHVTIRLLETPSLGCGEAFTVRL